MSSALPDSILSSPLLSSLLLLLFLRIRILSSLLVPLLLLLREQVESRLIDLVTVKRVAEHYHLEADATELYDVPDLDLVALHAQSD